ncbi:uncharacterized protein LOC126748723 isoform X2 [Anthonomus grandis grandis]|uniref:uncharacterized protein LOC126748723 isoform X2 n=1 Tax=Anthonomus grandis grandis TaxID=2921223 RepID=UPI002165C444|nr:uncharacterized protein LOC126748723 isoform X2 [Anthonomus grandis grandis]
MSHQIIDVLSSDDEELQQPAKNVKTTSLIRPHVTLTVISKTKEEPVMVLSDDENEAKSASDINRIQNPKDLIVLSDDENEKCNGNQVINILDDTPDSNSLSPCEHKDIKELSHAVEAVEVLQKSFVEGNFKLEPDKPVETGKAATMEDTSATTDVNNTSDIEINEISENCDNQQMNKDSSNASNDFQESASFSPEKQEQCTKDFEKTESTNGLVDLNGETIVIDDPGTGTNKLNTNGEGLESMKISNDALDSIHNSGSSPPKTLETSNKPEVIHKNIDDTLLSYGDNANQTEDSKGTKDLDDPQLHINDDFASLSQEKLFSLSQASHQSSDISKLNISASDNSTISELKYSESLDDLEDLRSISQEQPRILHDPEEYHKDSNGMMSLDIVFKESNKLLDELNLKINQSNQSPNLSELSELNNDEDVLPELGHKSNEISQPSTDDDDLVILTRVRSYPESIVIDDSDQETDNISQESKSSNLPSSSINIFKEMLQETSSNSDLSGSLVTLANVEYVDDSIVINDSDEETEPKSKVRKVFLVNLKKTACTDLPSPFIKVEPAFTEFLRMVEERLIDTPFEELLPKKVPVIQKYFDKCVDYTDKHYFKMILANAMENMRKSPTEKAPETAVKSFHSVYAYLKSRLEESIIEIDEESVSKVKKLEKMMRLLRRRIILLEEEEVDLSDEEGSAYLMMDRYRERFNRIYKKYCQILKKNPYLGRATYDKIAFVNSNYMAINRAISREYKNSLKFPTYLEVEALIESVNKEENLGMSEQELKKESVECFKNLGTLLQKKRRQELYDMHIEYIDYLEDPANTDPSLDKTLKRHSSEADIKLTEVIQEYVKKQEELELEEDEIMETSEEASEEDSTISTISSDLYELNPDISVDPILRATDELLASLDSTAEQEYSGQSKQADTSLRRSQGPLKKLCEICGKKIVIGMQKSCDKCTKEDPIGSKRKNGEGTSRDGEHLDKFTAMEGSDRKKRKLEHDIEKSEDPGTLKEQASQGICPEEDKEINKVETDITERAFKERNQLKGDSFGNSSYSSQVAGIKDEEKCEKIAEKVEKKEITGDSLENITDISNTEVIGIKNEEKIVEKVEKKEITDDSVENSSGIFNSEVEAQNIAESSLKKMRSDSFEQNDSKDIVNTERDVDMKCTEKQDLNAEEKPETRPTIGNEATSAFK